jgi:hypothetical protein
MSEGLSINDIINKNYDGSISSVPPTEIIKQSYILLIPHDKSKNIVIIYTGSVLGKVLNRTDNLYKLAETLDGIEIYTKTDETLEKGIRCKILQDNGYDTQSSGCNMSGGKRRKRRTKKNKKRKSKKCKSKRRRQK